MGIVGHGLIAATLRPSWLAEGIFSGDPNAIPLMAVVAAPTYVTPEKSMVALPEMLKFRQSSGAMFCLIILGVGVTLGHPSWIGRSYGPLTAMRWCVTIVALAVGGAFLIEHLASPVGTANADNDHFEEFTNPFYPARPGNYPAQFCAYAAHIGAFHWATLGTVAALATTGFMIRAGILFRRIRFEDFLTEDDEGPARDGRETKRAGSVADLVLPPWLVSATAAASFLALAAVGAYAFFPSPEEIFRDMAIIKADYYGEIGAASTATPLHHLDLWERPGRRGSPSAPCSGCRDPIPRRATHRGTPPASAVSAR